MQHSQHSLNLNPLLTFPVYSPPPPTTAHQAAHSSQCIAATHVAGHQAAVKLAAQDNLWPINLGLLRVLPSRGAITRGAFGPTWFKTNRRPTSYILPVCCSLKYIMGRREGGGGAWWNEWCAGVMREDDERLSEWCAGWCIVVYGEMNDERSNVWW